MFAQKRNFCTNKIKLIIIHDCIDSNDNFEYKKIVTVHGFFEERVF
jgi:hypothetical protein